VNLKGEAPLARLAAKCGLSVRHFARAFRHSTGVPPHRWLLKRRVDRARELLTARCRWPTLRSHVVLLIIVTSLECSLLWLESAQAHGGGMTERATFSS